jgi:hypothetical protein
VLPDRWPPAKGWLPVAHEAVRTAHAAHCAALALKGKLQYEDAARFLARRATMLLQLLDALITDSHCEEQLHRAPCADVLHAVKQAEEHLLDKVKQLLSGPGARPQLAKLLEQESLLGQASLAQIQLALMQRE